MSGSQNEGWAIEYAYSEETAMEKHKKSNKRRRLKRKSNSKAKRNDKNQCEVLLRNRPENENLEYSCERNSTECELGEDGGEERSQRLRWRQAELNSPFNEIDSPCVMASRDLTSKSPLRGHQTEDNHADKGKRNCPGSGSLRPASLSLSTCSEGSYSRRKHHKHLKHKHKHKEDTKDDLPVVGNDPPVLHPKVNPVFVWVRQEDTTIVEVLCEDYDYKNRLKLRRTHLGWRAIPKTKSFSDVLLPPAPNTRCTESLTKPKKIKRSKRWKKATKSKKSSEKSKKVHKRLSGVESNEQMTAAEEATTYPVEIAQVGEKIGPEMRPKPLTKSNSCDFSTLKVRENLVRSTSLNLKLECNIGLCSNETTTDGSSDISHEPKPVPNDVKRDIKHKTDENMESIETCENNSLVLVDVEEGDTVYDDERNHSEPVVMDMTKHDSDFNDADCEELGQLLKVIPDLEFVHEDELEEVDEEDWAAPTDLTLPKTPAEEKVAGEGFSGLPLGISPLISLTSAGRPSEPLTTLLPEVTITPIPKPAHQRKAENPFLESLLSSTDSLKPEVDERPRDKTNSPDSASRKGFKHFSDDDFDGEIKHKKFKSEDITLKNLLSKNCAGKPPKGMNLEKCVRNLKPLNVKDSSKSRLNESLTEKNCSDPISELKEVLSDPDLAVPDPLLVPRARLPALVASPASEIPRLLTMHLEKTIEEKVCPPSKDSDVLEVSLSNLESLLSTGPDTTSWTNKNTNIFNYHKSLETLLGWQKYQNHLMENQIKNSNTLPPAYTEDMATATALSQVLWLPYLNHLDFNANRNIMSFINSIFTGDYRSGDSQLSSPPQININHVPQPSPFLTPTSPMDLESHLKTLAMWQEAVSSQQPLQSSNPSAPFLDSSKDSKTHPLPKNQCCPDLKGDPSTKREVTLSIADPHYSDHHKRSRHATEPNLRRLEHHSRRPEPQQRSRKQQSNSTKLSNDFGDHADFPSQPTPHDDNHPLAGTISVKPLSNLLHKSFPQSKKPPPTADWTESNTEDHNLPNHLAARLHQFNTEIHRTTAPANSKKEETPKLKVKNLVDPNMSPPKLLKRIGPQHLPNATAEPAQDDGQGHLWHPLFGSNQVKIQPYNSPWNWTTVTVNGE